VKVKAILALCLIFVSTCSKEKQVSKETAEPPAVKNAQVVRVRPESVEDSFEAVGTVKARLSTVLSSKTIGTIVAVLAHESDRVRKGQILIEIDDRDLRAELQAAQAALEEIHSDIGAAQSAVASARGQKELAAATFNRYEPLVAKGSVTPHEFDEVTAKFKVASAELERAEKNLRALEARREQAEAKRSYARTLLSYSKIASPIDGIVTAKSAEVGGLASPGTPLITIEQSGLYRLEAQVGESLLAHVKLNSAVRVIIDAIETPLTGKVGEIVPAADPQSRTFTIKIDLPAHPLLRSGIYGKAAFSRGETQVLLAPIPAVIERGQLTGVFVVGQDGRVGFRLVKTGKRFDDKVEILSGLSAGERVVSKGAERLSDGSRIEPSMAK
jgi:membrane fusion protein, multidrug efflux system